MNAIDELLNIPVVADSTKFWMIRTKRGFFFAEFITKGFIAIGWNLISKANVTSMNSDQIARLKGKIKAEYGEYQPGAALNKCQRFCGQVQPGDIALIVGDKQIAIAIIGDYYEESDPTLNVELEKSIHEQISKASVGIDKFRCPYIKRRKIQVVKILDYAPSLSPYLATVIAVNRHSLSDLNDYAEIILSACYDAFLYKGKLTLTFRVMQQNAINAIDLSDFVSCAAKVLSMDDPRSVTVKSTLHSPGDILLQIGNFTRDHVVALIILYLAIFGGKIGNLEFNSLVGVIKDIINRRYTKQKHELELRRLEAETEIAEQDAIQKELQTIEQQRELHARIIEANVEPLFDSSKALQISPDEATIVDISRLLQENSTNTNN